MTQSQGRLQIVATPIGNRGDLSPRAREALARADSVIAEDTRRTRTLLSALGIARPLLSLHTHNESQRVPELLSRLTAGETLALVSDAGTPLLSDPGYALVRAAAAAGIAVQAVPGPSALTAALSCAALPVNRFCFEGFLPAKPPERRAQLARLASEARTLVFFEAPHRIAGMLADLSVAFGAQRHAAVARELTKTFETVYRGTLSELAEQAQREESFRRGELTVVVEGAPPRETPPDEALLNRAAQLLAKELPPARAAALAAQLTGASRSAAYALVLQHAKRR